MIPLIIKFMHSSSRFDYSTLHHRKQYTPASQSMIFESLMPKLNALAHPQIVLREILLLKRVQTKREACQDGNQLLNALD